MTKAELQSKIDNLDFNLAEVRANIKTLDTMEKVEEAKAKITTINEERSKFVKEMAELEKPITDNDNKNEFRSADWVKAAVEKRAIQIGNNGTGSVLQIKNIFKTVAENDDLLNAASFYYGPNAATNIPVLTPMSDPTAQAEGSDSVGSDSAAGVTVTKLEPYAYARVLPVSAEMLTMGAVNIESEIPELFTKAFRKVIHSQMLTGSGSSGAMKGIFTSAAANAAADTPINKTTGVTLTKLAEVALKVSALDETYTFVMNPTFYQTLLSENSDSEDIKIYKEGLIRDKSIEGVKIVLDSKAPTANSSGSVAIVAAPLSRYAIGVAGEMTIDPIKVKGDTSTYYQATMFFNGKQVADSDIYEIVVGS